MQDESEATPDEAHGPDRPDSPASERVFGARVRQLRERLGITQAELAVRLGVRGIKLDPTAITKIEKGRRSIRLDEAVALAKTLDVTIDELLRPALPPREQMQHAKRHVELTEWRAYGALGEHAAAKARLERLQQMLTDKAEGE